MNIRPTFVTSNASKAEQLSWHLGVELGHLDYDIPEIQSLSLLEVVEHKAKTAFEVVRGPVLVEDTSLVFHALGRLPGPLIKWFLKELGNEGLCNVLNQYPDRSATATVLFGYYDGNKLSTFAGQTKGTISKDPLGQEGFGWDPIFIPEGYIKTWGQMSKHEQKDSSIRRVALTKLELFLKSTDNLD